MQPLSGELLSQHTSNSDEHARLDVYLCPMFLEYYNHKQAFMAMDVRIFAKTHFNQSLSSHYRKNEKKWPYKEYVRNV